MESPGRGKLITMGFWLGVGFIVPLVIGAVVGGALLSAAAPFWEPPLPPAMDTAMDEFDRTESVRINSWKEAPHEKQLLILGVIENTGQSSAASIELEAELLDRKNELVFECSEYITKKLKPGEKENFQIKCGCGQEAIPAHTSVKLRVVKALAF